MSSQTLIVKDIINNTLAITEDSGELLWESLKKEFEKPELSSIILDFSDIELVTTAFLNKCIGIKLFDTFATSEVMNKLKIKGIQDKSTFDLFKLVLDIAINASSKQK